MFTGLVQSVGTIAHHTATASGMHMVIQCGEMASRLRRGDSVSVHGVCLTAVEIRSDQFEVDVIPQTLSMTTLGAMSDGDSVNLEPALRMGDPMGVISCRAMSIQSAKFLSLIGRMASGAFE